LIPFLVQSRCNAAADNPHPKQADANG